MTITQETRRESFDLTIPHISNRKEIILSYLQNESLTASEIADRLKQDGVIKFSHRSFAAPRLTELEKDERIFSRGYRFCKNTQRNEAVYYITQNWYQAVLV